MSDTKMEFCEIEYSSREPIFGAQRGTLTARATGPSGTRVVASRADFKIKKIPETVQTELNALVNQLIAEGWESQPGRPLTPTSPIITPRFQRRIS